jgi:hypothetical protein
MELTRPSANHPRDIQVLKTYSLAPYAAALKKLEQQIKEKQTSVNEKIGVKVFERYSDCDITSVQADSLLAPSSFGYTPAIAPILQSG